MDDASMACEDLKFFEKRLTEVITYMGPTSTRWRISLVVVIIAVSLAVTGSKLLASTYTESGVVRYLLSFVTSLQLQKETLSELFLITYGDFTLIFAIAFLLFAILGVHRRIVAPTIIANRCRDALAPFSLSCDHNGKLIVKPALRNQAP